MLNGSYAGDAERSFFNSLDGEPTIVQDRSLHVLLTARQRRLAAEFMAKKRRLKRRELIKGWIKI